MSVKQGFFNLGTGQNPNKTGKARSSQKKVGCDLCRPHPAAVSSKIEPLGEGKKKILILTECLSKKEDLKGKILTGKEFLLLKDTLKENNIDMNADCWRLPAVRCLMEENREPSTVEVGACRASIFRIIHQLDPSIIILMGPMAISSLIQPRISGRLKGTSMTEFISYQIPDQDLKKWLCPVHSPHWILNRTIKERGREVPDPVTLRAWKHHIKKAIGCLKKEFPEDPWSTVDITTDPVQAIKWIQETLKEKPAAIAFDYEATGLKPHRESHEIKTCSYSDGNVTRAFPYFEDNPDFVNAWDRLLRSKKIGKIAHKMDFENNWTKVRGPGNWVNNWEWDTCLGAHVVHNKGPVNQKFLTYVHFGVIGYDDGVDKYLTGRRAGETGPDKKLIKGKNSFNRIEEADLGDILKYNGQDSGYCKGLYQIQKSQLKGFLKEGYRFFLEGAETLSKIQNEGMCVNTDRIEKHNKILEKKINRRLTELQSMPEWDKWDNRKAFNPDSEKQLSHMLYDILKYEKPENGSLTDESQLKRLNTDFTKAILPYRKLMKMKNTYLAQFRREEIDGKIHPFFNLHIPDTFRSSSDSPNFQNMPARDPEALKWVMSCIVPRPGNRLGEYDYKGVEVTVSTCYHKDPNMIKYIKDPTTDMHRDTAADILLIPISEVSKYHRQMIGKNGYVFPAFYGSGPDSIAPAIWERLSREDKRHLRNEGIKNFRDFTAHIASVSKIFWGERFPVYAEWKQKTYHDYLKKGYVELLTGFRCYGPMDYTQVTNYPIQGAAFHCLLWSLINIYREFNKKFHHSHIIGQIHDAIVADINPKEEPEIDEMVKLWGTKKIREHWDWIILPMKLEKEAGPVDGSWNLMEGLGYL